MTVRETGEETYEKVRVYTKQKRRETIPEQDRGHPFQQPYKREPRHSLMIDGLGEEDEGG